MQELEQFKEYLKYELNLSDNTVKSYSLDINLFLEYLKNEGVNFLEIDKNNVRNYMSKMLDTKTHYNKNFSSRSVARILCSIKKFYKFLSDTNKIPYNPTEMISTPKIRTKNPEILYANQMFDLLNKNYERTDKMMPRDQAILELMFCSGLRCSEVINLTFDKINFDERYLRIIGKGNKERIVPFTKRARKSMIEYQEGLRAEQAKPSENVFFLSSKGEKLTSRGLEFIMKSIVKKTGFDVRINLHPHVLRHTFATYMISKGCDIRIVQEILGHESLSTTQVYTHVNIEMLKETYKKCF